MAPEFIGALIALVSALAATFLVEALASRRRKRERLWSQMDQGKKERIEKFSKRYDQAEQLVDWANSENLKIVEGYHIAERAQHEDLKTYDESINALRSELVNSRTLNEYDQLLSVVNATGDEDLIDLAGDFNSVYNTLISWIDKRITHDENGIEFNIDDTQIIEGARTDSLFYYRKFHERLETLRFDLLSPNSNSKK
jgi:hypothetical protein